MDRSRRATTLTRRQVTLPTCPLSARRLAVVNKSFTLASKSFTYVNPLFASANNVFALANVVPSTQLDSLVALANTLFTHVNNALASGFLTILLSGNYRRSQKYHPS